MKKLLLLPLGLLLSIMTGCMPEAGMECVGGACADKKCGPEKCTRKLPVEVTRDEQYTVYKEVEKDCVVETKVPVVKKVPVKTWKYIQKWVDTEVQEPYTVTENIRVKAKVPVVEEYMAYETVAKKYETTVDCPKTIVNKNCECQTVKGKRTITECDKCGNQKTLKVDSEWQVPAQKVTSTIQTAKCPVAATKMVEVPVMKKRTVMRDGYKTEQAKVTKYRTVPGKKLIQTRICETIMKDEVTYQIKKETVKRMVKVPEIKTRSIKETVIQDVVVDCRTGERMIEKDDTNAKKPAEATKKNTPQPQKDNMTKAPENKESKNS